MSAKQIMFVTTKNGQHKGEVTAVFTGCVLPKHMESTIEVYGHVGQHSTVSSEWIASDTVISAPEEYKDLKQELISIGYKDIVVLNEATSTYSRNPTRQDAAAGYGVAHHVDFPLHAIMSPDWKIAKYKVVSGKRYSR